MLALDLETYYDQHLTVDQRNKEHRCPEAYIKALFDVNKPPTLFPFFIERLTAEMTSAMSVHSKMFLGQISKTAPACGAIMRDSIRRFIKHALKEILSQKNG